MRRFCLLTGCLGLLVAAVGCGPGDTSAADTKALQDKEAAWSKDAASKDVAKITSYYAPDATLLMPNSPIVHGTDAIKSVFTGILQDPNFSLSFKADKVEVSGTLGYTQGAYEMTMSDQTGKKMEDKGKYLTVWKKQADGGWLALEDMISSDLPAVAVK